MLGKLLKYDIKATGRILLPLFAALLGAALLMGFTFRGAMPSTSFSFYMMGGFDMARTITTILYTVLIVAVVILTFVMIIYRGFYQSLFGNEGYLRLSLPVSTGQTLMSKVLNAAIWLILAAFVSFLSFFLVVMPAVGLSEWARGFGELMNEVSMTSTSTGLAFKVMLFLFVAGLRFILKVFASISLGSAWTAHPGVGALLAFIGISIVESIPSHFLSADLSNFGVMSAASAAEFGRWLVVGSLVSAAVAAIFYAITWYMIDRRVSLQ